MSTTPIWTILITTLGQRQDRLAYLLRGLMPQVDRAGGLVKVVAYFDNGELTDLCGDALGAIAEKRQALVMATTTKYLSFVDDDDTCASDFVPRVVRAFSHDPDFVGFWSRIYKGGSIYRMAKMSLEFDGWAKGGAYLCRDITHVNPMRTAIAQTVDFRDRDDGQPEDVSWAAQLRTGGLLKTQVFIDKPLHYYWWVPSRSTWTRPGRVRPTDGSGSAWQPLEVSSPNFSWHPDSIFPEGRPRVRRSGHRSDTQPSTERTANAERLDGDWRLGRR